MNPRLRIGRAPEADPAAVVEGDRWRFTVLTRGVVRLEWSEDGVFEDRASTFAVRRHVPVPDFEVRRNDGRVEILTADLHLDHDGGPFSPSGLSVSFRGGSGAAHTSVWRHGQPGDGLLGTARTLDDADGAVPLGGGAVSRSGIAVIDDSASFVVDADGIPSSRRPGTQDLYVFAHGHDYRQAVRDLYAVSGGVPVLPRWALGNWWSRFHRYSDEEYLALLDRFDAERLPLSVAVLDMDWHLVDVDPRYGTGWTGYTWNRELFPDPPSFLRELHERGLRITLNVHPADGIRAHEEAYPEVAAAMGVDPASEQPVAFDPTDPRFLDAYFAMHHELEEQGVDFWWLDWQQGQHTRIPGVDPLWLLNIAHFHDSGRGGRRALTFSRYAGPGSHRYPIGFSGDTIITWESLAFQPYFTATASNIGYGWWSHDIGGHWHGGRDDDLTLRWVQLGAFSPILRLHSSQHPFIRKEPWAYPPETAEPIARFLRLRHRLVPYLHTMNARAAHQGAPLVEPMYWGDPEAEPAYRVPNQFRFGTELVVAPITAPQDPVLQLGSARAWLPPGRWTDLFTGTAYAGGREVRLHRTRETLPVLVRAGGLLPLGGSDDDDVVGVGNPGKVELVLAPGADGGFDLLEEAGESDGADPSSWARTPIRYDHASRTLVVGPVAGPSGVVPAQRRWRLTVLGATAASAEVGGRLLAGSSTGRGSRFELGALAPSDSVAVTLRDVEPLGWAHLVAGVFALLDRAQVEFDLKLAAYDAVRTAAGAGEAAARVQGLELGRDLESALLELVLADHTLTAPTR